MRIDMSSANFTAKSHFQMSPLEMPPFRAPEIGQEGLYSNDAGNNKHLPPVQALGWHVNSYSVEQTHKRPWDMSNSEKLPFRSTNLMVCKPIAYGLINGEFASRQR